MCVCVCLTGALEGNFCEIVFASRAWISGLVIPSLIDLRFVPNMSSGITALYKPINTIS